MSIIIESLDEGAIEELVGIIKETIQISFGEIYPKKLVDEFCGKYNRKTMVERMKYGSYWIAVDSGSNKVVGVIGLKGNQLRCFYEKPKHHALGGSR